MVCGGKDLWKRYVLSLQCNSDGMTDDASDDDELSCVE